MIDSHLKDALIKLLDDPSPVVHKSLLSELQLLDTEGVDLLKAIVEEGAKPDLVKAAKVYLRELVGEDTVEQFIKFIRGFQYELETGCIMLDRVVYPEVEAEDIHDFLDEVAGRCDEILPKPYSALDQCRALNRVLFHEYGFEGDHDEFYSPKNSFLSQVIERRKGIPITLSIIYMLVAQRWGLQLEPIGLPGRFMVGCFVDESSFYIDTYEGGVILSAEEVQFLHYHYNIYETSQYLAPIPVGEVLARMCRNLAHQYVTTNDEKRAALFLGFLREFEEAYRKNS